jgi:hypothetical protein
MQTSGSTKVIFYLSATRNPDCKCQKYNSTQSITPNLSPIYPTTNKQQNMTILLKRLYPNYSKCQLNTHSTAKFYYSVLIPTRSPYAPIENYYAVYVAEISLGLRWIWICRLNAFHGFGVAWLINGGGRGHDGGSVWCCGG